MTEQTIVCPNCKTEFKLTESLAAPLIEAVRKQYEQQLAQKDSDIAKREQATREKEKQLAEAKTTLDEQVANQVEEQLKKDRAKIAADEARKAKQAAATDLEQKARELTDLQEVLKQRDAKLAEAQNAQAELIKKQRELDDAKRELELTVQKRIQEGLAATRQEARKEAEDELNLKVKEKDQTISSMQQKIEELKRRAEQGSQQLQGEVLELELENLLRSKFPFDSIEPVPPNLTIYNKLIADFTPNTPKYVYKGIAEFATDAPALITGDNYEAMAGSLFDTVLRCKINIFNVSKINSEVRGGKSPRIKRLSEYIGESYFDYLAGLPDLVLLMDESHRYRASAGIRAINELKPILGLELTATPFVESARGAVAFKNVIYDYPLGIAMADGFVKEPAVVTRKNFNPAGMSPEEIERLKLEDGIRLHESVKVDLETYARETDNPIVKPFLLVIARDTTHAGQLLQWIQSDAFFEGRYKDKVIQVDSSRTGAEEEEMIERLLKVEHTEEPTEIVIHVNMLKEGWDVTNLYTIVPLRAANARILIEQSIGRGLRLPYGKRTGVTAVDRLNIVAHDRFQEIIDAANQPDSAIRMQAVVLDPDLLAQKTGTVVSQSQLATKLGLQPAQVTSSTTMAGKDVAPLFTKPEEQKVAQIAYEVIRKLESQPQTLPTVEHLTRPEVQAAIVKAVEEQRQPGQLELEGVGEKPDIAAVVAKTAELYSELMIGIPRILVVPKGEVKSGFKPFMLKLDALKYPAVSEDLWVKYLRTGGTEVVALGRGGIDEVRLEDYVVSGLVDFNDVSYDVHADLLYDLATQTVRHLQSYLSEDETRKVLRCYQRDIARFIHAQMQEHYWEDVAGYDVKISKGFTELKSSAYTYSVQEPPADYRVSPSEKTNMAKYLFGGFSRCLYSVQKFESDAERKLAVILEREASKWFKPAKGQFQIFYRQGADHLEYQPDFVAETADTIYMLEPKASNQLDDPIVLAKKDSAIKWCRNASEHAASYRGKPWRYVLIPHDAIADNMTLGGLAARYGAK